MVRRWVGHFRADYDFGLEFPHPRCGKFTKMFLFRLNKFTEKSKFNLELTELSYYKAFSLLNNNMTSVIQSNL